MSKRTKDIKSFCKEYMQIYNVGVLSKIKIRCRMKDIAKVKLTKAYNKNYSIYFNKEYLKYDDILLKSMTFHEMTHIADSIIFQSLPYNYYRKIMNTYSECHASEIEFDVLLDACENLANAQSLLILSNAQIPFDGIIKQDITQFKLDFYCKPFAYLFYAIGHTRSLKMHNINYEKELLNLIPEFDFIHDKISSILNCEDIDYETALDIFELLQKHKMNTDIKLQFL